MKIKVQNASLNATTYTAVPITGFRPKSKITIKCRTAVAVSISEDSSGTTVYTLAANTALELLVPDGEPYNIYALSGSGAIVLEIIGFE